MKSKMKNTKNLASYGAVLACVGLSPHAQASIVDLGGNLPGPFQSASSSSSASSAGSVNFDLLGSGSNNFFQTVNNIFLSNGLSQIGFANASSTLYANSSSTLFAGSSVLSIGSAVGTAFLAFVSGFNQLGWIQIDFGGGGGPFTYLAAAFNDTPGGSIHVGTYATNATSVPEPSSAALMSLGLLAAGASGVRKLRKSTNSQGRESSLA